MPIYRCVHATRSLDNPNVSFNEGHAWAFVLDLSQFETFVNMCLHVVRMWAFVSDLSEL